MTLVFRNRISELIGKRFDVRMIITCFLVFIISSCNPPVENTDAIHGTSKPWVFWYWMHASVSKEGITADLEAMKQAGIGGAYLMPIKGPTDPPMMEPPVIQLSREWWAMVKHAVNEADRLGLKLAMHASDGFALAGGPWITPELSMQKIVWTETIAEGKGTFNDTLPQPETKENYYRDIAVFAFPSPDGTGISTDIIKPKVITSLGTSAQYLVDQTNSQNFKSDDPCWIQYTFDKPFTCRSITVRTNGNSYQAQRLIIEVSDDGKNFTAVSRLQPPRHGWQDGDADVTHVIPTVTSRYFRFVYDKKGSEPGAEDLDAAKWKPSLKVSGIRLSSSPAIHQYEGKTGEVWRVSLRTTKEQIPDELCVKKESILDLTANVDKNGRLKWDVPQGKWTILRIGHTSTGHTNYTGGGALGLECDKFNPEAVHLQFENWFGEAIRQIGSEQASDILKIFHIDSWECGSQNWSPVFSEEFRKRRGYDLISYLPVMAGIPVESADVSERFLHDVRQTIAELVHDNFYGTMTRLAQEKGCQVSAESVAPTMTSDGMLHYNLVDLPMGEFWLRSPTHDKPNDMLDAISGAHVYGKPIIQAEAFTELRMAWDEHPAMLKVVGDRNYALGVNRLVYHVFTHNPWTNRKPGMTLDGVGLYFQRDQTWWKSGRAWMQYTQRCQQLLQQGKPVVDIAVFTGEETPRRALLPDRLVPTLPGIFGDDRVKNEAARLLNTDEPLREMPDGVRHSANMADPEKWTDPLRGYQYDSFNKDALLRLTDVRDGKIEVAGGASYRLLVIPGAHPMSPHGTLMTPEVAKRLHELIRAGATVLIMDEPLQSPSLANYPTCDQKLKQIVDDIWKGEFTKEDGLLVKKLGKGRIVKGPYQADTFKPIGIARDFIAYDVKGKQAGEIAWTHRKTAEGEIYFVSNQSAQPRALTMSLRSKDREPEIYNPVTGEWRKATSWRMENGRTTLPVKMEPHGSLFIVLRNITYSKGDDRNVNWIEPVAVKEINTTWNVTFDSTLGGPAGTIVFDSLTDWSKQTNHEIKYYSGTAVYTTSFDWNGESASRIWLDLGNVANIAEVYVNNVSCGVAWTTPYRVEITEAIKKGKNSLIIKVTNTWANRLIGDQLLPEEHRITKTTAPYRLKGKPLLPAGLLGPVTICTERDQ